MPNGIRAGVSGDLNNRQAAYALEGRILLEYLKLHCELAGAVP
jgi:hypothetical protein